MQDTIVGTSAQARPDFAGLLAALSASKPTELPNWNEEDVQPDVATLSYERALRTHARYKAATEVDTTLLHDSHVLRSIDTAQREMRACLREETETASATPTFREEERKCASVTIRMSKAEREQLHARAAEAGLTISAYLRSCTFEAEALRAQVKEALTELRSAHTPDSKYSAEADKRVSGRTEIDLKSGTRLGWLRKLMPDLHPSRKIGRA